MVSFRLAVALLLPFALLLPSCETLDGGPKPPQREKLSSIPHNMPASWEGQAGMPGMMSGQY
ncbi:MAG TPA: hypothetical protein PLA50_12100 [Bacteroidia bacterium]|nr:hypothetical protein [Bacteroidia bacterium]